MVFSLMENWDLCCLYKYFISIVRCTIIAESAFLPQLFRHALGGRG